MKVRGINCSSWTLAKPNGSSESVCFSLFQEHFFFLDFFFFFFKHVFCTFAGAEVVWLMIRIRVSIHVFPCLLSSYPSTSEPKQDGETIGMYHRRVPKVGHFWATALILLASKNSHWQCLKTPMWTFWA